MSNEKRMLGDYEITHSVHIGKNEIVMGENADALEGERYIVADCKREMIFLKYENCYISDDFTELAEIFAQRLTEQVETLKQAHERMPCGLKPISRQECTPLSGKDDITGEVIVLDADKLRPEHRVPINQLYLVTGGNGARLNARGTAVYCTNLYSKEETRVERYEIIGILRKQSLPEWAEKCLADIAEGVQKHKPQKEEPER